MRQEHQPHPEAGNVLFLILIAVVLFAALSFAVTQSNRISGNDISEEILQMEVNQMFQFFSSLRFAADRMVARGMDGADIVFACTSGEDCIYAPEGGSVVKHKISEDVWNGPGMQWAYASTPVKDVGTGAADRIIYTGSAGNCISGAFCKLFNDSLGIQSSPIQQESSFVFIGGLDSYPGEQTACFEPTGAGSGCYWIYQVIVAN